MTKALRKYADRFEPMIGDRVYLDSHNCDAVVCGIQGGRLGNTIVLRLCSTSQHIERYFNAVEVYTESNPGRQQALALALARNPGR